MARAFSWLGLAVGIVVAVRLVPWLFDRSDGGRRGAVLGATLAASVAVPLLGEAVGWLVGRRVAPRLGKGAQTDRVLGAVTGLVGVAAVAWLVIPVARASSDWSRELVGGSVAARVADDHLPAPPDVYEAIAPLLNRNRFPQLFDTLQPSVDATPPAASGIDATTAGRVARSVVLVDGVACRVRMVGSGFVVGDALVVTNAHVVAGQRSTSIVRDDGKRMDATVVAYDENRDLALLTVPGIDRPALALGRGDRGDVGGVFGHPGGEPLRIAPFLVTRAVSATGRDIYDDDVVRRDILELAAEIRHGDSGSALVDASGAVIGVAVAISTDEEGVAYALAVSELTAVLAAPRTGAVSTGACLN